MTSADQLGSEAVKPAALVFTEKVMCSTLVTIETRSLFQIAMLTFTDGTVRAVVAG